ncbi:MAG: hypothetical protein HYV36_05635 [Lentisphaerae bacterium]|nr:hypothetical protein [Lentisphaerota bacterium]
MITTDSATTTAIEKPITHHGIRRLPENPGAESRLAGSPITGGAVSDAMRRRVDSLGGLGVIAAGDGAIVGFEKSEGADFGVAPDFGILLDSIL